MLARRRQLELRAGVHLLKLSACSVVTRVTVQSVSMEPLVNFFTIGNHLPSVFRFLLKIFCFGMPPLRSKRQCFSPTSQHTSPGQASKKKGRLANSTSRYTNSSDNTTRSPPETFLTHQDIPDIVGQAVEEITAICQVTTDSSLPVSNVTTIINVSNSGTPEYATTQTIRQMVSSGSAPLPGTVLYT